MIDCRSVRITGDLHLLDNVLGTAQDPGLYRNSFTVKTCRNIPRTYLTDETKTSNQPFFICPFPWALLCPLQEKIRLFLIQCVVTLLLCYLSRAQAAAESQHSAGTKQSCSCTHALSPQVLPIAERKLICFFLRPLLLLTVRKKTWGLESSTEPRGSGMAEAMSRLNLCTWPGAEDKRVLAGAGQSSRVQPGPREQQQMAGDQRLLLLIPADSPLLHLQKLALCAGSTLLGGQSVNLFFPMRSHISTNL